MYRIFPMILMIRYKQKIIDSSVYNASIMYMYNLQNSISGTLSDVTLKFSSKNQMGGYYLR